MSVEEIIVDVIREFFQQFNIRYSNHSRTVMWLTRYYNFRLKYIPVINWQIRVSKELTAKLSQHPLADGCFDVFLKAATGKNLNPHQSRESFNSDYHDGMFNDWGIHHLHLDAQKKNPTDFFCNRTGPLLFVKFEKETSTAYCLDIQEHSHSNVWSNRDFIRIIQLNWPQIIGHRDVGINFSPQLDDKQIGQLRRKGYTFGINVDGKSYLSIGHGYATSGDNMMAGRLADELWRWVGTVKPIHAKDPLQFKRELKNQLGIK